MCCKMLIVVVVVLLMLIVGCFILEWVVYCFDINQGNYLIVNDVFKICVGMM